MTGERRRALLLLLGAVALLLVAHGLDSWAVHALKWPAANDRDWGRMLRVMGAAPTWLAVALALWVEGRSRSDRPTELTAAAVLTALVVGGLGAEAIKILVRRNRPDPNLDGYVFRSFADRPFNTSTLGFPSSHAMVAFGGAAALSRRFPRASLVVLALAVGCGLTRLFAQAHFLSDVVGGALGGTAVGDWAARRFDRSATKS